MLWLGPVLGTIFILSTGHASIREDGRLCHVGVHLNSWSHARPDIDCDGQPIQGFQDVLRSWTPIDAR